MRTLFILIIVIVLLIVGHKILFQQKQENTSASTATAVTNGRAIKAAEDSNRAAAESGAVAGQDSVSQEAEKAAELPDLKAVGQHDRAGKITRKRLDGIGNRINQIYDKHNRANAAGLQ